MEGEILEKAGDIQSTNSCTTNLRASSYIVDVKIESEQNKHLLIHGYTGAMDVVNTTVLEYLKTGVDFSENAAPVSKSTFDILQKRGYLTTKTEEEEREYVIKFADLLHQTQKKIHKSFMFMVAYDCNFRCSYCYESKVLNNSRKWTGRVFTKQMVDKAYHAISMIESELKKGETVITSDMSRYSDEMILKIRD